MMLQAAVIAACLARGSGGNSSSLRHYGYYFGPNLNEPDRVSDVDRSNVTLELVALAEPPQKLGTAAGLSFEPPVVIGSNGVTKFWFANAATRLASGDVLLSVSQGLDGYPCPPILAAPSGRPTPMLELLPACAVELATNCSQMFWTRNNGTTWTAVGAGFSIGSIQIEARPGADDPLSFVGIGGCAKPSSPPPWSVLSCDRDVYRLNASRGRLSHASAGTASLSGLPPVVTNGGFMGKALRYAGDELIAVVNVVAADAPKHCQGRGCESLFVVSSKDEGKHWQYRARLDWAPEMGQQVDGWDETDLVALADGCLLICSRTGSPHPMWCAKGCGLQSGSVTWTRRKNGAWSVYPRLLRLTNGALLLASGRPGLFLWINYAGDGESWERHSIPTAHNSLLPRNASLHYPPEYAEISSVDANQALGNQSSDWHYGPTVGQSTAYTSLTEVEPNVALLTYDRLARGWAYPPGPEFDEDFVFAMRVRVSAKSDDDALFVAPHHGGSDSGLGTAEEPLRTLHAARDLLRARRQATGVATAATVFLREGVHDLSRQPLQLDERDANVHWRAFPGEQPVLSGGVRVPLASATPWPAVDGALQVDLRSFGVDNVGAIPMPNISKNGGLYDCQHGLLDVSIGRSPLHLARWPNKAAGGQWKWAQVGAVNSGECKRQPREEPLAAREQHAAPWQPSAKCQTAANAVCEKLCDPPLKARGTCDTPTLARYGASLGTGELEWRCYSPSTLTPDRKHFQQNCTANKAGQCCLCSDDTQIRAALKACGDPAPPGPPPPAPCPPPGVVVGGHSWFLCPTCGERPARWAAEGAWLHGYFDSRYSDAYLPLRQAVRTASGYNLSFPKPPHERGLAGGNIFMVTGALSELDAHGEFYVFANGTLVFMADTEEEELFVSVAPSVLELKDTSHITLSGLRIAHARGTGILGSNLSKVRISNCVSELHGEDGIRLDRSRDSSITDSQVSNVGCVGVAMSGGNAQLNEPGNLLMEGSRVSNFSLWKRTYRPGLAWAGVANEFRSNIFENGPHSCVLGGAGESPTRSGDDLDGRAKPTGSVSCVFFNNTFRDCAYECGDCGAWYTGGGHSFTDVNNSIVSNTFVGIGEGGTWAQLGLQEPSSMQVHAVYMDDMMSGYTIRDNAFINCTNAVKMSGQDIKIVANKCDGCYAVVHVNPVGVKLPHECAAELRTLDALIATPPWNESFPSLQRIADERACAPVNAFVHDNTCTRTGAGGFLMPEINATWKWSMGNNTCKSDDAVAMATGSTQLFLDDKLLETQRGTRVVMHPLQVDDEQHRPVLVPGGPGGGPWEGGTISAYNSVVQDGPRVMIYYNVISANGPVKDDIKAATCVAISSDFGRTFSKPSLGLVSFNGSTDNNIVMPPNATAWSPGTVFLDDNPDAPADEKYKMIAKWFPDANRSEPNKVIRDGSWTFASPDGLRWRPLSSKPVYLASDTQDVALFDATLKKYVAFRRLHQGQSRICRACAGNALQPALARGQWREAGCVYQQTEMANKGCELPSRPLTCRGDADCAVKHQLGPAAGANVTAPACFGKALRCIKGFCGAFGIRRCNATVLADCPAKEPDLYCIARPDSGAAGFCGPGMNALRFVGRCESSSLREIERCDEGILGDPLRPYPKNETQITTVFGPDERDSPCTDIYTSQAILYQGHYIAFPAAYSHYPSPPVWPHTNDGVWTTRIMHSRDGKHGWEYVARDRRAFLDRGPPGSWRASMVAVARGLAIDANDSIRLFVWGSQCRHGQGQCTEVDGAIVPIDIRGFASLQSAPDGSPSVATTKPLVFKGSRLLVNAKGASVRVAISPVDGAASSATLADCVPVSGDAMDVPVAWVGGRGENISSYAGVEVRITFELTSAQLFSFHFDGSLPPLKSDDSHVATNVRGAAKARRVVRGWVSYGQGLWPNCSHHEPNCDHGQGALGMIAKHADVVDGVFLYCEVSVAKNGSVYLPGYTAPGAAGAAATCSSAVAALRAIKRPAGAPPLTVQGVISLIHCPGVEQAPTIFIESAAAFADEFNLDGLNLDWEACAYYCDAKPVDCGCYGCPQPCTCQPAGFGTKVAQTVNALGKKLLQKKRKLTVALGVLKKDLNGQLVHPPYVYPNISTTGSATSDITRLLKDSPFLERVTDMDMYYQNATDPNLAHPDFFAQCVAASQLGFGDKLGVGLGAYQAPFRDPSKDRANLVRALKSVDQAGAPELDLFAIDSRSGAACKTCAPAFPGPTPPDWWWPLLAQWKAGEL